MKINVEHMNGNFHKVHLLDLGLVLHRFLGPDACEEPHDHPFDITVTVLEGGYVEHIYALDGKHTVHHRHVGDTFTIPHDRIHCIADLPEGTAQTIASYGPFLRPSGFWKWEDSVPLRRQWDRDEWVTA